jgi:homoserine kinase
MPGHERDQIEIRVPASSANLGAGFDCFGLALDLHLTLRATILDDPAAHEEIRTTGEPGSHLLPHAPSENLIFKSMRYAAKRESIELPRLHIAAHNTIPLAAGLGSSAAAIVGGIRLAFALGDREVSVSRALRYATEIEGHADNVSAALLGGLTVTCIRPDGEVAVVKKQWPVEIRAIVVTPNFALETAKARAVLPRQIDRADAVYNLQRSALLIAALDERRYDLIWDALQDRIHQPYRQHLIPGLAEILNTPQSAGLLGIALSGAGPSVIALASDRIEGIGRSVAAIFEQHGLTSVVRCLAIADAK